jgi:hypothetical protein
MWIYGLKISSDTKIKNNHPGQAISLSLSLSLSEYFFSIECNGGAHLA